MPSRTQGGRSVAWREAGNGAPALLLHCALAHSGAYPGLIAGLEGRLALRALDLPGHGGTDYDPARDLHEQATADALDLLADRGPAHLIGHSFGGTVALRLAHEAPDRVASLTLIEPVFFAFLADADPEMYVRERADQAASRAQVAAGNLPRAAADFLARWGAPGGLSALPPAQAAYIVARMPLIVASDPSILHPATAALRLRDLTGIACPTTLIAGGDSPAPVHAILDAIAAAMPHARRVTVPGAGHMVPVTHPEPVSAAIRDTLGLERREETRDVLPRGRPVADEPRR